MQSLMGTETNQRVLGQTTEDQNLKTVSQIADYFIVIKIFLLLGFHSLYGYKYRAAYITLAIPESGYSLNVALKSSKTITWEPVGNAHSQPT